MTYKYPSYEPRGDSLRRWMENPSEPGCPIPRTELTIANIDRSFWHVVSTPEFLDEQWSSWARGMGLPVDVVSFDHQPSYHSHSVISTTGEFCFWIGRTGPGVIFMDNIRRSSGTAPYMSEYTKAFYEMNFPLESVKYVVVTTIINAETAYVRDQVYESLENLRFPRKEPQTWDSPSPEFCALLGTPMGKLVSAFVLGTYGQGVKRIARVVSFHTGNLYADFNLRFDIEDV